MATGERQQEASVAGESPDKVEREKSSGETTESGDAVARPENTAENERNAKAASTTAPAETEDAAKPVGEGGDETADDGTETAPADASAPAEGDGGAESENPRPEAEGAPESGDDGDERLKSAVAAWIAREDGKHDADAGEGSDSSRAENASKADETDETDKSGKAKKAEKSGKARKAEKIDKGDPPTAMFGVVRRNDESEDAAARAERMTTAFFGAPKFDKGDEEEPEKQPEAEPEDERPGKPEGKAEEKSVDQPTAVFRTMPANAEDAKKDQEKDQKKDQEEGAEESPSENTTVLKLPSEGKAKPKDQPKDQPKGKSKADPRVPHREESASEQTSQFVPLKSADAPRAPAQPKQAPKPEGEPRPAAKPEAAPPVPAAQPQPAAAADAGAGAGAGAGEAERTRQQPLPEPPPLDLLAQLTNTPPPPATPLRTLTRRVKIWTPLVLLLAVLIVVAQAVRPLPSPELDMTAAKTFSFAGSKPSMPWPSEGQAVVEVDGLGSLGSYGEQKPVPIASVAKVMTAYVILRDHPVKKGTTGAKIPVDQKAEDDAGLSAQNESTVDVKKGQTLTEKEAMNAIMIASANNVARLLARWDAGSEKAFVKKMNDAAKELGMTNTTYTDPSGLRAETRSTAADQVKLGKKVMDIPLFQQIVKQSKYEDLNGKTQPNWNKLVPVDGVVGIKTGTTTKAGGNLLFAAEKEIGGSKQLIVGAVLGQYKPSILDTVLGESKKLIDTAQDAFKARKVVKKGDVVGYVDDQLGGRTPVVATRDVTAPGWSGLKVKLALTDDKKSVPHTGGKGDEVGTLTVGQGLRRVEVPVALQEPLTEPGFGSKLTRIL